MINQNPSQTKRTPQNVLVNSYDEDFNILAVEVLGHDGSNLQRIATDADGNIKIDPTNLDTRYVQLSNLADTTAGSAGCDLVGIDALSGATWATQCDFNKLFGSAGRASGGTITDAGSETVNVSAGTGFIKATDSDTATLISFDWSATNGLAIPTNTIRYIKVQYNSGTPNVVVTATEDWDLDTSFPLGKIVNEAGTLHILNNPWWVTDGTTNIIERLQAFGSIVRDDRVGGLALSVNNSREVGVTAGVLWSRLVEFPFSTFTAGSTFETYWRSSATVWTSTDLTVLPITQWNRLSDNTLQTIDNNKYFNWWIYVEADDGEVACIYPQRTFNTAAEAEAVSPPTAIPTHVSENGILIGRVIFKQGVATPILVQSAFSTVFTASQAADHGNLAGLADDDHSQYALLSGRDANALNIDQIKAYDGAGLLLTDDGGTGIFVKDGGDVGIGTLTPEGRLHVADADLSGIALFERSSQTADNVFQSGAFLSTKTSDMGNGFGTSVGFAIRDDADVVNQIGIFGTRRWDGHDDSGRMVFSTADEGTFYERMIINPNGYVGIGLNELTDSDPVGMLDIASGNIALTIGANLNVDKFRTNNSTKLGIMGMVHYANAQEPVGLIAANSTSTGNFMAFGGGSSKLNAATAIAFYAASNNTTTTGTEQMRIISGGIGINESAPNYRLDVNGDFGFTPGTSVTPVDNGDVVIEATDNTTLTFKLKGSDGTVRSGTVTLS